MLGQKKKKNTLTFWNASHHLLIRTLTEMVWITILQFSLFLTVKESQSVKKHDGKVCLCVCVSLCVCACMHLCLCVWTETNSRSSIIRVRAIFQMSPTCKSDVRLRPWHRTHVLPQAQVQRIWVLDYKDHKLFLVSSFMTNPRETNCD